MERKKLMMMMMIVWQAATDRKEGGVFDIIVKEKKKENGKNRSKNKIKYIYGTKKPGCYCSTFDKGIQTGKEDFFFFFTS